LIIILIAKLTGRNIVKCSPVGCRDLPTQGAFSKRLTTVPRDARFPEFLVGDETIRNRFIRTRLMEESGHATCQPQCAGQEDGRILRLLDRLYLVLEVKEENRHRTGMPAVSSAVWIAQMQDAVREMSLVVNGIALASSRDPHRQCRSGRQSPVTDSLHSCPGYSNTLSRVSALTGQYADRAHEREKR
jgi:hypothetical protein